ncbi:hypothetical protein PbDSM24746_28020 [Paenibacillus macerans]|nr:hypothetical protein PbDSM24746_28020 [Paenibacillus macerans]GBK69111.1 hypothetical protein PbJCM17693_28190 [Paenibacillus macerans]GIP11180.1 hypothetical protein J1TS5_33500 [Paenibacillus macerans]
MGGRSTLVVRVLCMIIPFYQVARKWTSSVKVNIWWRIRSIRENETVLGEGSRFIGEVKQTGQEINTGDQELRFKDKTRWKRKDRDFTSA